MCNLLALSMPGWPETLLIAFIMLMMFAVLVVAGIVLFIILSRKSK